MTRVVRRKARLMRATLAVRRGRGKGPIAGGAGGPIAAPRSPRTSTRETRERTGAGPPPAGTRHRWNGTSAADQAAREVALDLVQRHALLLHRVALTHGDRVVLERVE